MPPSAFTDRDPAMSNPVLDNLYILLAEQLATMQELANTAEKKQRVLVHCQLDDLQALAEDEQFLASRLNELESRRLNALNGVDGEGLLEDGRDVAEETLVGLIQRLPLVEQPRFIKLLPQLRDAAERIRILNGNNEALTANLLDYTGMVMRLLTSDGPAAQYGAAGRMSNGPSRAMLDSRV